MTSPDRRRRPTTDTLYLDIQAVMRRWGSGYDQVWSLIRRGDLPAMKIGRRWIIRPVDLEAYEARRLAQRSA